MYDPATIQAALHERLGTGIERIPVKPESEQAEDLINGFWSTWTLMTFYLLRAGFAPRELCDAANDVTTVKEEVEAKASRERV